MMKMTQKVGGTKAGWYVEAFRSAMLCRVYMVKELRADPMFWGPYKREKFAKKLATTLRKDRCETVSRSGVHTDHGPSFVKVRVFEVQK